ncbi:MAG: GDSL-type esterase/lipase family protein [Actinobacteria bacterium]|nr:GDSL-type esterase/lipase family protein [Actinomycetota bacterium]
MRRLVAFIAFVAIAALPLVAAQSADAAGSIRAVGAWSMVPQAKDADGDGFIDGDGGVPRRGALSLQPSATFVGVGNRIAQPNERLIGGTTSWYLSDRGFPVSLNACKSLGDRFRWTVRTAGSVVSRAPWKPLNPKACRQTVFLPEADYQLTLEVAGQGRRSRVAIPATVSNLLVVALGDSYASGEGNPRNVLAWMEQGGTFTPYWDDNSCRRSTRAAPAQAALALEQASASTSVTLVFVACSGATVNSGILGAQAGAQQSASQLEQATAILGGRAADLVLLSIGGNDVGFTTVLTTCALSTNCPTVHATSGPLSGYGTVQDGVQGQTAALAGSLDRIAACIGTASCTLPDGRTVPGLALSPTARVLPTLYPDITRASDGQPCSYLTIPQRDFAWARETILNPAPPANYAYPLARGGTVALSVASGSLNQQIAASARIPGWSPVSGTWSASGDTPGGHGVCAGTDAWVFPFTGLSGFTSASFHPNPAGQVVLGRAITAAATAVTAV